MSDLNEQISFLESVIKRQEEDKVLQKKIWNAARKMNERYERQGEEENYEKLLNDL